ncbi:MAG: hypothetical protein KAH48_06900, partial [Chlorobi bacterium]|nr:hypothetical protein [Chlorobiota bacterium]
VISSTELRLRFSEEMNKTDVENIANYSLAPLSAVSSVELSSADSKVANIYLNPSNPLSAVGKNYTLTVTNVNAVSNIPITKGAGNTLGFVFTADNPDAPFVYPNPVRMSEDADIYFANIPAKATIHILSLSGELLRTITENDGNGGAEWDGRDRHGDMLKHGVYLYKVIQIRNDGSTVESGLNKFAVLP